MAQSAQARESTRLIPALCGDVTRYLPQATPKFAEQVHEYAVADVTLFHEGIGAIGADCEVITAWLLFEIDLYPIIETENWLPFVTLHIPALS